MSAIRLRFQDGRTEEFPLGDGQLLIRLEPSGGIAQGHFAGGVYSASELKSVELPDWVAIAPPPEPLPPLKEIEEDLSVYASSDVPGVRQRIGPKHTYRRQVIDWPEPEPPKPKRKRAA